MRYFIRKSNTKTLLSSSESHRNCQSQLTSDLILNVESGLNKESTNVNHHHQPNHILDIKPNESLTIPSKSLSSLDNLPKRRSEFSRSLSSNSLSSNSIDSLSTCSNFNEPDLTLLYPAQTSTPILRRNLSNKKQVPLANSKSPKHKQSNTNLSNDSGISTLSPYRPAYIQKKSFLKTFQDMLVQQKEEKKQTENEETSLNNDQTEKSIEKSIPASASSLNCSLNDSSVNGSLIINPNSGTVKGTINHVRTSIKQVFERSSETHATNPVLNAQLNNVIIYSLHDSINYDMLSDSIDQSVYDEKGNGANLKVVRKFSERNQAYKFLARNYEIEECHKIVIYTTSIQIVRLAYDKCLRVKKILQNLGVRFIEKDLNKHRNFQKELKYRLNLDNIDVPHVFYNGRLVGNCDQLELYSDQGLLHKLFKDVEKIKLRIYCVKCGGYRYVLCLLCNGSKKKFNNFTNLKCTNCSEDGLIRCDECLDQQE